MEKVHISAVRNKFKDVPEDTKFQLKHDLVDRTLILTIEGKEPVMITCPDCEGNKWVVEGALKRCLKCNSLFI